MAVLSTTNPTLADFAARLDGNDKVVADIVEILGEENEVLQDMTFIEANEYTSHRTTVRSGLPQGTWRKLNYGVQPEKSQTVPVRDTMGMLESYAEVDKSLADLNGNSAAWRLSEDRAFVASLMGRVVEPGQFANWIAPPVMGINRQPVNYEYVRFG